MKRRPDPSSVIQQLRVFFFSPHHHLFHGFPRLAVKLRKLAVLRLDLPKTIVIVSTPGAEISRNNGKKRRGLHSETKTGGI